MKGASILLLLAAVAAVAWISCKDEISGPDLSKIVFPDSGVSYRNHVQPLFDRGCGGQISACHGPETFADHGYSLDNYNSATNKVGIIVRGSPDASLLNQTVEGRTQPKMPPVNTSQLTANQITGLRKWVAEGARGDN